jgi:adenylate cyclase
MKKWVPLIRKNKGFINQYLGDAIMAIFPGNARDALSAAVEMQQSLKDLNNIRSQQNLPPIYIGIGMHSGPLIMGITGDKDRLDATTISDTVNTAARIESLTKYYKASIILSDASLQQIEDSEPVSSQAPGFGAT